MRNVNDSCRTCLFESPQKSVMLLIVEKEEEEHITMFLNFQAWDQINCSPMQTEKVQNPAREGRIRKCCVKEVVPLRPVELRFLDHKVSIGGFSPRRLRRVSLIFWRKAPDQTRLGHFLKQRLSRNVVGACHSKRCLVSACLTGLYETFIQCTT